MDAQKGTLAYSDKQFYSPRVPHVDWSYLLTHFSWEDYSNW